MRKVTVSAYALLLFVFLVRGAHVAADQMGGPFGLSEFVAPESFQTWQKWKKVITDAGAEFGRLQRCPSKPESCTAAELRFLALVQEAKVKNGRAKIEFANQQINGVIRYRSDSVQWGIPDKWTLPIDPNDGGSFTTGAGDCEDFALAKYGVLHLAGIPHEDLRIVLLHDNAVKEDHAVLAVHHDRQWLILDNRWNILLEDKELARFKALMAIEWKGVYVLAKALRLRDLSPASNATSPDTETHKHRLISPADR